ncbi:HAD family hydrolase [Marinospirillum sp.]|uniref:HAD family hydrolase n=1 Tax=Marinospirillum sp. TaxID=2183934 RepID=UPI00384AD221
MQPSISSLIFDCDGVLLNSNSVKTQAFYQTALHYSEAAAHALVDYHTANGGISRYKKFAYFCDVIFPSVSPNTHPPNLDDLLSFYAKKVRHGLLSCEVAKGLFELRELTAGIPWMIVSGGDQAELQEIFAERGLHHLFDGGIFGSPDSKDDILKRVIASGCIQKPALFLGDSQYDYQAASRAGLDFLFVSQWTEVKDWQAWAEQNGIDSVTSIKQLLKRFS